MMNTETGFLFGIQTGVWRPNPYFSPRSQAPAWECPSRGSASREFLYTKLGILKPKTHYASTRYHS